MSIYKMSESAVMKFVNLYKKNECLWDTTSIDYKNRDARIAAYNNISEAMNIDGFGVHEVAQKIKNLRSSYYQEIKRIENSKQEGDSGPDLYKPKVVWFNTLDSFLKRHVQKRAHSLSSMTEYSPTLEIESTEPTFARDTNEEDALTVESSKPIYNHTKLSNTNVSKRRRKTSERNTESCDVNSALNILDEIYERASKTSREDEFECFGRYVAATLRNLPTEIAISAESRIQVILSQERINAVRKHPFVVPYSNPPSVSSLETNYNSPSSLDDL